ncbi:hypothetical protein Syn7502_03401 [Synechococcus sp. PCC 7502]|nr:hypothetical protein Syn7502_03401 [Synechococcus sp. PCC 7502]
MALSELILIGSSCLVLFSEFKKLKQDEILSKFVSESHVILDRLDIIEETLIKLLRK